MLLMDGNIFATGSPTW